ncbi:MAG: DUF1893 domain-containing protein [Candidatus Methanomethylicia archaeon]
MGDLEIAKKILRERKLTLAIVKNKELIFESNDHGIIGFINAIEELGGELKGAYMADKIVGRAIALLAIYSGIKGVYAEIISKHGFKTLIEVNIEELEYGEIVDAIMDKTGRELCPFEREAQGINDPSKAYEKFKLMIKALKG